MQWCDCVVSFNAIAVWIIPTWIHSLCTNRSTTKDLFLNFADKMFCRSIIKSVYKHNLPSNFQLILNCPLKYLNNESFGRCGAHWCCFFLHFFVSSIQINYVFFRSHNFFDCCLFLVLYFLGEDFGPFFPFITGTIKRTDTHTQKTEP